MYHPQEIDNQYEVVVKSERNQCPSSDQTLPPMRVAIPNFDTLPTPSHLVKHESPVGDEFDAWSGFGVRETSMERYPSSAGSSVLGSPLQARRSRRASRQASFPSALPVRRLHTVISGRVSRRGSHNNNDSLHREQKALREKRSRSVQGEALSKLQVQLTDGRYYYLLEGKSELNVNNSDKSGLKYNKIVVMRAHGEAFELQEVEIEALGLEIDELQSEKDILRSNNDDLRSENETLRSQLEALSNQLEALSVQAGHKRPHQSHAFTPESSASP